MVFGLSELFEADIAKLEEQLKIAIDTLKMYASLNGEAIRWPDHDHYSYLQDPAIVALAKITNIKEEK